jgi:hypothetical protein
LREDQFGSPHSGCERRSVITHVIEDDFGRLLKLLTIQEDALPLMVEMAVQSEHGRVEDDDFEAQKQAAIAKCKRRIENARFLFLEGDISQEEFLKRQEFNERQVAHWEARTTEAQKAAIELAMCMEALDNLARLWGTASDEDRGEMARVLFEYVTYNLDRQQIVDFRLKPWADRYLVLRASLYGDDDGVVPGGTDDSGDSGGDLRGPGGPTEGENDNRSPLKSTSDLCPIEDYGPSLLRRVAGDVSRSRDAL